MTALKNILIISILINGLTIVYPLNTEGIEGRIGVHSSVFPASDGQGLHRGTNSDDEQERWNEPRFVSGELLIKFKNEPLGNRPFNMPPIKRLNDRFGMVKIEKIFPSANLPPDISYQRSPVGYQISANELSRWYKVILPDGVDISSLIEEYQNNPEIEFVEPNYMYKIAAVPNDSYHNSEGTWGQSYQDLWGLYKIYAEDGWDIETGSDEVVVAVVDTGLDSGHQDIVSNLWVNEDEIPGNYIDDDGNGYVDDINGWNFVGVSGNLKDGHGHGTHVAGIIAATGNNGIGISGLSWNSRVMALKSLNDDGYGITGDLAKGIRYAVDNGARVINMSWGGRAVSQLITDALDYAYGKGCVLIIAAGNSNSDASEFFPANYNNAITVAATDSLDVKASFSNYGSVVDVCAPGVDILSLRAEDTDMYKDNAHTVGYYYYRASGTSMATPYVSGLAALILSRNPDFSHDEVTLAIIYSTDDLGIEGKDIDYGHGRINVYKALETADGNLPAVGKIGAVDTPADSGHSITLFWNNSGITDEVKGYRIYYSRQPFKSINDEDVSYFDASPNERNDVTSCVVTGLGDENYPYYFAVIANMFDIQPPTGERTRTSNSSSNYISTIQAVYPVDNVVDTTVSDDVIIAGGDPYTKVVIPQGTNNGKILDITLPERDDLYLTTGSSKSNEKSDGLNYLDPEALEMTTREFKSSEAIEGKVRIVISYPSEAPASYEDDLRIYKLDEFSGEWEILPGIQSVNTTQAIVTAETEGSDWYTGTTYRLFVSLYSSENLSELIVYPNPYKPNSGLGHTNIIFDNLTENAKIRVFNIAGELVRTMTEDDTDGRYEWNATNDGNERLASGVYIYLITDNSGHKKTGKLAVIR